MPQRNGKRRTVLGRPWRPLMTVLMLSFLAAFRVCAAAEQPSANKTGRPGLQDAEPKPRLSPEQRRGLVEADQATADSERFYRKGDFPRAVALAQRALDVRQRILGKQDPHTASSFNLVGLLYWRMGEYPKAEPLLQQALDIRTKVLGLKHPETAQSLKNVGVVNDELCHYAKAEELLRQALAIQKTILGEQHGDTASSLSWLAAHYWRIGKNRQAEPLYQQALAIQTKVWGELHPDTAETLNNLGVLYRDMGLLKKGEALLQRALEVRKKVLGEQHPDTAETLNLLATMAAGRGDYAKAFALCQQSLSIRKKILGEASPITAYSLNNLASLYQATGEYAKAEPLFVQALEIRRRVLGDEQEATVASLNMLALHYATRGNYAKAEPLFHRALEIREKILGAEHPETMASLNNLALLYQATADYAKAEALFQQSLAIGRKVLGEKHLYTAGCANNLAWLYFSMGDYAKAEPLYRQGLEIRKSILGDENPDTAYSLSNLGLLYGSMGDYAKAEPFFRRALEIRTKMLKENHPDIAASRNNLAVLYVAMGDYAKAEPLVRQALASVTKAFGPKHPSTLQTANNLASLYASQGDDAKAEALYRQSVENRKAVLGAEHPDTANSLNELGLLYLSKKDYAKAEPLLREALRIRQKVLKDQRLDTAVSRNNLALLYHATGDYAKAEPLFREGLEQLKKLLGPEHPNFAKALNNLAGMYWSMGEYAKAEPLDRQALEISQKLFDQTLGAFAERQQLTFEASLQVYLHRYLSLVPSARVADAVAYGYVLKSKGAVTARESLLRLERRRPDLKKLLGDLQSASSRLANLSLAAPDPRRPDTRLRQIEDLTEQKEAIERKLAAQSGEFARIQEAVRLAPEQQLQQLKRALPARTALVDILDYKRSSPPRAKKGPFETEQCLLAFVVRPDGETRRVDLGATAPIAKAITAWRQTYGTAGSSDSGKTLRSLVWEPLEPHLSGADTILLSPDGPLHQFPMAALPGSKPGRYLLEERNIVIAPIPRLLPVLLAGATKPAADPQTSTPLLVGDVDFDSARKSHFDERRRPSPVELAQTDTIQGESRHRSAVRGNNGGIAYPRLPGTAPEIQEISSLFEGVGSGKPRLLTGSTATVETFRLEAPRHRWLHIATHGFFAPETVRSALDHPAAEKAQPAGMLFTSTNEVRGYHPGLLSGIVFAGANAHSLPPQSATAVLGADRDEGIMTALEVADLDLSGVDLVVLSACETGLGHVAGGEGVMGLQRAFELAGARTCVASLWKVDDAATQVLMTELYTNLWRKKLGKLDALRQAQLRMLHEYDPKQKKLVSRGLDIPEGDAAGPQRGSPFYWAAFVLSGDWR